MYIQMAFPLIGHCCQFPACLILSFLIQKLPVGEEERCDSLFHCLQFLFELFVLLVFAKEKKISVVCALYFKCFSKFEKNCLFFFRLLLEGLGNRDGMWYKKSHERGSIWKASPSLMVTFMWVSPFREIFAVWWDTCDIPIFLRSERVLATWPSLSSRMGIGVTVSPAAPGGSRLSSYVSMFLSTICLSIHHPCRAHDDWITESLQCLGTGLMRPQPLHW